MQRIIIKAKHFFRKAKPPAPEPVALPLIEAMRLLAEKVLAAQSPLENITCRLAEDGNGVSVVASMTSGATAEVCYRNPMTLQTRDFDSKAAADLVRSILRMIPPCR